MKEFEPTTPLGPEAERLVWRKELESFLLDKELTEWSDSEKESFYQHTAGRLNNFPSTIRTVLSENSQSLLDDGVSMKEYKKWDDQRVALQIERGENSLVWLNNSSAHFLQVIKETIIETGADIEKIKFLLNENKRLHTKMLELANKAGRGEIEEEELERFAREEGQKSTEYLTQFYIEVLPTILKLLDKGYTRMELAK